MTEAEFNAWPKCAVPACALKSCRALASRYCWPHTPGTPEQAAESAALEFAAARVGETVELPA